MGFVAKQREMRHKQTAQDAIMQRMSTNDTTQISITFRAPASLVRAIDDAAAQASQRLAIPVDRSALIRRALAHEFQGLALADTLPTTASTADQAAR